MATASGVSFRGVRGCETATARLNKPGRRSLTAGLKIQLQGELHLTRRVSLRGHLTKCRRPDHQIRRSELRMIQGVESLRPEFQQGALAERERELLEDRER